MTPASSSPQDHIARTLAFFHQPGDCFEIRAIGSRNGRKIIDGGFFDDQAAAARAVSSLVKAKRHDGIYLTINAVDKALLGRANNRMVPNLPGAQDKDVALLRRLLVDLDPERPAGVASTEEEHEHAIRRAEFIRDDLVKAGWPEPLVGDSGNGCHLVFLLPDFENTPEIVDLLKRVLQGLSEKYTAHLSGVTIKIDEKVFNPSRISKIFGTVARKGDHTKERPHRWARIISLPDQLKNVSIDLLNAIALPPVGRGLRGQPQSHSTEGGKFDLAGYLQRYGVSIKKVKDHRGSTLHVLEQCLFDDSHRGGEAAIGQTSAGVLFYQCFHDSCKDKKWCDARQIISGSDRLFEKPAAQCSGNGSAQDVLHVDWEAVSEVFPRTDYPWEVLPKRIARSLKQLARACASSPNALPGAACCILASTIGRLASVSPKDGWEEPLIFWHGHISPSGTGKTPAPECWRRCCTNHRKRNISAGPGRWMSSENYRRKSRRNPRPRSKIAVTSQPT
jgi:hypothetical protein